MNSILSAIFLAFCAIACVSGQDANTELAQALSPIVSHVRNEASQQPLNVKKLSLAFPNEAIYSMVIYDNITIDISSIYGSVDHVVINKRAVGEQLVRGTFNIVPVKSERVSFTGQVVLVSAGQTSLPFPIRGQFPSISDVTMPFISYTVQDVADSHKTRIIDVEMVSPSEEVNAVLLKILNQFSLGDKTADEAALQTILSAAISGPMRDSVSKPTQFKSSIYVALSELQPSVVGYFTFVSNQVSYANIYGSVGQVSIIKPESVIPLDFSRVDLTFALYPSDESKRITFASSAVLSINDTRVTRHPSTVSLSTIGHVNVSATYYLYKDGSQNLRFHKIIFQDFDTTGNTDVKFPDPRTPKTYVPFIDGLEKNLEFKTNIFEELGHLMTKDFISALAKNGDITSILKKYV
ncbi:hypothetical protein HDE_09525 [Halotydeus destructor]|nr:hypothetical protein HDE_09525 [Halotydeus destructor]